MAKQSFTSIIEVQKQVKNNIFLPVYFFFGVDNYMIDRTVKLIDEKISGFIVSDFDKVILSGSSSSYNEIVDSCLSFPFGSEKKLVIVKEFENLENNKNEKSFVSYLNSPSSFSVLICINNEEITKFDKEYLKALINNNYIFEAKELKEAQLISWLLEFSKSKDKILSTDNAKLLIDIVGENRNLLEMQLEKIFIYLNDKEEITFEVIKSQVAETKEYTFFNLQDAIAVKNKTRAFKIAFNLLEVEGNPKETMPKLLGFINKFFTGLAQIPEMTELINQNKLTEQVAARVVGTHPYYYKNYKNARTLFDNKKIFEISQALLEADIATKTTSIDEKTVLTILLNRILN